MNTSVTIVDDVLSIRSLDVTDDIVVTYISQLEPAARVAGVVNCLQLGARSLTFASDQTGAALLADKLKESTESTRSLLSQLSSAAEQSVEKSTANLKESVSRQLGDFEKELGKKLDPENTASIVGRLRTALLEDYGRVTNQVRTDLDLANPRSPLAALRSELYKEDERRYEALANQLRDLLQQSAAKVAGTAERSKSTLKGGDFETATEEFLTSESKPRKDLVRRTAREHGLDQNKAGDFVIEINPADVPDARIVVESKNGHNSTTELLRELNRAIRNRGAAYGIAVVTDPRIATHAITQYGDNKLFVRVPALSADEWDFTALGIALEGARWKMAMGPATTGLLDVGVVTADIDAAFKIADRFATIKQKITASRNQLDGVSEYVDGIKGELEAVLQRIRNAVAEARAAAKAA
jgi:hypothetical protein